MILKANVPVGNSGVTAPAPIADHYFYGSSSVLKLIKYQNHERDVPDATTFILAIGARKSVATTIIHNSTKITYTIFTQN
ncbi:hypothetical protein HB852_05425 [Listeria grandensis]|uniref:hypothetical protein n=1 Tax=Listeria grandensis TaxID=1494963 RepID=UPI00162AA4B5|nr:hypothetical protein [Listeria grandensis]MBC1474047.1 hypothetical protein [Listeria grandensis]